MEKEKQRTKFVFVLKERLSYKLSFDEFLNFTNKAELSINGGDFQSAITTLWEVHSAMSAGGYIEEFLRVSKLLFNTVKWSKKNIAKLTNYESLLQCVIMSAVQYGDDQFVDSLLNKFESLIENKEESYIRLCYLKSYTLWFRREFDDAVGMCEEASYLLERADQPDKYGVKHNQALAYRDSGNNNNICKALDYFLNNNDLSELINAQSVPKEGNGSLLGNVGKCLALQNELENALICYYKSFYYIFHDGDAHRILNKGYAAFWITESLMENGQIEPAYYFLQFALDSWKNSSPVLANRNI